MIFKKEELEEILSLFEGFLVGAKICFYLSEDDVLKSKENGDLSEELYEIMKMPEVRSMYYYEGGKTIYCLVYKYEKMHTQHPDNNIKRDVLRLEVLKGIAHEVRHHYQRNFMKEELKKHESDNVSFLDSLSGYAKQWKERDANVWACNFLLDNKKLIDKKFKTSGHWGMNSTYDITNGGVLITG